MQVRRVAREATLLTSRVGSDTSDDCPREAPGSLDRLPHRPGGNRATMLHPAWVSEQATSPCEQYPRGRDLRVGRHRARALVPAAQVASVRGGKWTLLPT